MYFYGRARINQEHFVNKYIEVKVHSMYRVRSESPILPTNQGREKGRIATLHQDILINELNYSHILLMSSHRHRSDGGCDDGQHRAPIQQFPVNHFPLLHQDQR